MRNIIIKITETRKKLYWQDISPNIKRNSSHYYLRCPKCHKTFIIPKKWGVWKGCPVCWTKLAYKKGTEK